MTDYYVDNIYIQFTNYIYNIMDNSEKRSKERDLIIRLNKRTNDYVCLLDQTDKLNYMCDDFPDLLRERYNTYVRDNISENINIILREIEDLVDELNCIYEEL